MGGKEVIMRIYESLQSGVESLSCSFVRFVSLSLSLSCWLSVLSASVAPLSLLCCSCVTTLSFLCCSYVATLSLLDDSPKNGSDCSTRCRSNYSYYRIYSSMKSLSVFSPVCKDRLITYKPRVTLFVDRKAMTEFRLLVKDRSE